MYFDEAAVEALSQFPGSQALWQGTGTASNGAQRKDCLPPFEGKRVLDDSAPGLGKTPVSVQPTSSGPTCIHCGTPSCPLGNPLKPLVRGIAAVFPFPVDRFRGVGCALGRSGDCLETCRFSWVGSADWPQVRALRCPKENQERRKRRTRRGEGVEAGRVP